MLNLHENLKRKDIYQEINGTTNEPHTHRSQATIPGPTFTASEQLDRNHSTEQIPQDIVSDARIKDQIQVCGSTDDKESKDDIIQQN